MAHDDARYARWRAAYIAASGSTWADAVVREGLILGYPEGYNRWLREIAKLML